MKNKLLRICLIAVFSIGNFSLFGMSRKSIVKSSHLSFGLRTLTNVAKENDLKKQLASLNEKQNDLKASSKEMALAKDICFRGAGVVACLNIWVESNGFTTPIALSAIDEGSINAIIGLLGMSAIGKGLEHFAKWNLVRVTKKIEALESGLKLAKGSDDISFEKKD